VNFKDTEFLLALLIVIVTALLMVAAFLHWINVSFLHRNRHPSIRALKAILSWKV